MKRKICFSLAQFFELKNHFSRNECEKKGCLMGAVMSADGWMCLQSSKKQIAAEFWNTHKNFVHNPRTSLNNSKTCVCVSRHFRLTPLEATFNSACSKAGDKRSNWMRFIYVINHQVIYETIQVWCTNPKRLFLKTTTLLLAFAKQAMEKLARRRHCILMFRSTRVIYDEHKTCLFLFLLPYPKIA